LVLLGMGRAMSSMRSISESADSVAALKKRAVMKKPAVVKKPAAAVKKPAAAVRKEPAVAPLARKPSSDDESSSERSVPRHHRHLSIDGFAAAHLEDLGSSKAGEVVLEATAALRRMVKPDREFSFLVPDTGRGAMRRFVLDRCTPGRVDTYELEVEVYAKS
jgi:hypothetical protein